MEKFPFHFYAVLLLFRVLAKASLQGAPSSAPVSYLTLAIVHCGSRSHACLIDPHGAMVVYILAC